MYLFIGKDITSPYPSCSIYDGKSVPPPTKLTLNEDLVINNASPYTGY